MSRIFYISDTHFYHNKIIQYCKRPFPNVEVMNDHMINMWNKVVSNNDLVYHLGDFGFASYDKLLDIFNQLNGRKILVKGNHDDNRVKRLHWEDIIEYWKTIDDNGKRVFLCHYPLADWDAKNHGTIHLHGHIHNAEFPIDFMRFNVSVDVIDFKSITLDDLIKDNQIEEQIF